MIGSGRRVSRKLGRVFSRYISFRNATSYITNANSININSNIILSEEVKYFCHYTPFFNGYYPQFYFAISYATVNVLQPEGTEMVMTGDNLV